MLLQSRCACLLFAFRSIRPRRNLNDEFALPSRAESSHGLRHGAAVVTVQAGPREPIELKLRNAGCHEKECVMNLPALQSNLLRELPRHQRDEVGPGVALDALEFLQQGMRGRSHCPLLDWSQLMIARLGTLAGLTRPDSVRRSPLRPAVSQVGNVRWKEHRPVPLQE